MARAARRPAQEVGRLARWNSWSRKVQPSDSSNQVTIHRPRRRQPHRAHKAATSWGPRPPSASRSAGRSSGVPARRVDDLDPEDADRDYQPTGKRPGWPKKNTATLT